MSETFTKLFSSITESTVWCEPAGTRLVWITMLAMADKDGKVMASVPGLANRARVTLEETETALATFLAPDPYSRTPDNEGRRIAVVDRGWLLLNHAKFRGLRDEETRKEQNREAQSRHRWKVSKPADSQPPSANPSAQADTDTEAEKDQKQDHKKEHARSAKRGTRLNPDWHPSDDLLAWAKAEHPAIHVTPELAKFRDFWAAKAGAGGVKLDWPATFRNWIRNAKGSSDVHSRPSSTLSPAERVEANIRAYHEREAANGQGDD